MVEYITLENLCKDIRENFYKIPKDCLGVIGIPRSGMIPAGIISEYLNIGLCSIGEFLNAENVEDSFKKHGTRDLRNTNGFNNILVVEDTCFNGFSLKRAMDSINEKIGENNKYNFIYMCVYLEGPCQALKPDIYIRDVREIAKTSTGRCVYYEWNLFAHCGFTEKCLFDLDGVICVDPPDEKNIDEYYKYICNPIPLFIPTVKKINIMTYRLNKYRKETENFLKKIGFCSFNVIMFNADSYEERSSVPPWLYKGTYYMNNDFDLFVESNDEEAKIINQISKKPVYCVETNKMYNNK